MNSTRNQPSTHWGGSNNRKSVPKGIPFSGKIWKICHYRRWHLCWSERFDQSVKLQSSLFGFYPALRVEAKRGKTDETYNLITYSHICQTSLSCSLPSVVVVKSCLLPRTCDLRDLVFRRLLDADDVSETPHISVCSQTNHKSHQWRKIRKHENLPSQTMRCQSQEITSQCLLSLLFLCGRIVKNANNTTIIFIDKLYFRSFDGLGLEKVWKDSKCKWDSTDDLRAAAVEG